jgi:hypothetical protein
VVALCRERFPACPCDPPRRDGNAGSHS